MLFTPDRHSRATLGPQVTSRELLNVLEILELQNEVIRSFVVLFREGTNELYIEASRALSDDTYKADIKVIEGIAARVIENAKPRSNPYSEQ